MIGTTRRSLMIAAPVAIALLVTGCSGGSSTGDTAGDTAGGTAGTAAGGATSSATVSPAAVSPAAGTTPARSTGTQPDRTVEVSVSGRKVTPAPGRVQVGVGDEVRIVVTSDVANMVHVHGVDVEKKVPAGTPTTVQVTMDQTGVFEVEMHDPALLLFQFVVR